METGSGRSSSRPARRTSGCISFPEPCYPLSGSLRGPRRRLSAPLFLLMRFSCLSNSQSGAARVLTAALSLPATACVCVHVFVVNASTCLRANTPPFMLTYLLVIVVFAALLYVHRLSYPAHILQEHFYWFNLLAPPPPPPSPYYASP